MSAAKRKGTAFETAVVDYLRGAGLVHVERRALAGARDRGDIAGVPGWALECKNTAAIDLAGAVDEARTEAGNAGARLFAAIVKRRRRGVSEAYVVMPLAVFVDVVRGR